MFLSLGGVLGIAFFTLWREASNARFFHTRFSKTHSLSRSSR